MDVPNSAQRAVIPRLPEDAENLLSQSALHETAVASPGWMASGFRHRLSLKSRDPLADAKFATVIDRRYSRLR